MKTAEFIKTVGIIAIVLELGYISYQVTVTAARPPWPVASADYNAMLEAMPDFAKAKTFADKVSYDLCKANYLSMHVILRDRIVRSAKADTAK
jgi:hypothetical protein